MLNCAGSYRVNFRGESAEYRSFIPSALPNEVAQVMNNDILNMLIKARNSVAVLDSLAHRIPDINLFIYMNVRKESLLSSQIEGMQATLEDIFNQASSSNIKVDVLDVANYVRAVEYAVERLKTLPLCNRLIREAHAELMQGVRGSEKNPGEFRTSQNWLGGANSSIASARYIPPNVCDMVRAMSDLEQYMNSESELDPLIRVALIHYQFETIHPFLDGNGRIGRLLITLFLIEKKVLSVPILYMSYFLKRNRVEYYDRMTDVRLKGNYKQWILFFLQGIYETAEDGISAIDELTALHNRNMKIITGMGSAKKNTLALFQYLEKNPIIEVKTAAQALNMHFSTASNVVKRLLDAKILFQQNSAARNRVFTYTDYLNILKRGT